jgi:hypothetical protein
VAGVARTLSARVEGRRTPGVTHERLAVECRVPLFRSQSIPTTGEIDAVVGSGTPHEKTVVARILLLDRKRDLALLKLPLRPTSWLT